MEEPSRKVTWTVWAGLWLTIAIVGLAFALSKLRLAAPPLPVYSQIVGFTLTNQFAQAVNLANLTGQVWVADIIFTRCPGPCARMTRQMAELQSHLAGKPGVKLISLTTDPDFDQPEVLQRYGEKFGVRGEQWWFLTGTKPELGRLAVEGLKFTAVEKNTEERENAQDLFIHSTIFALVDKQGRLRGVFETQPSAPDESDGDSARRWSDTKVKILTDVRSLLAEEPNP